MSTLGKILLIVNIIITIAVCVVGYLINNKKAQYIRQLEEVETVLKNPGRITLTYVGKFRQDTEEPFKTVKSYSVNLNQAISDLEANKTLLETTKSDLDSAKSQASKLTRDTAEAVKKAEDAKAELDKKVGELDVAQKQYTALKDSLKGEDPAELLTRLDAQKTKLDTLEESKKKLEETSATLTKKVDELTQLVTYKNTHGAPDTLSARIVAVNRPWSFVVLDVGKNDKLVENVELTVYRGDTYVGKIRTVSVDENTAVADIMPGWDKGEIQVGDQVIF